MLIPLIIKDLKFFKIENNSGNNIPIGKNNSIFPSKFFITISKLIDLSKIRFMYSPIVEKGTKLTCLSTNLFKGKSANTGVS